MNQITLFIFAYLLGSIPFGWLISRFRGVEIRDHGSGNIGATNVFRVVGKSWGLLCFFLDFCKGLISAGLLPLLLLTESQFAELPQAGLIAGACTIAGHNWTIWLKFKGGKGIATSGGVIAAVAPWAMAAGLGAWLILMFLTRIVSVSSMAAALTVAAIGWLVYGDDVWVAGVLTLLAAVAIWRHRSNIGKLLRGEENRFGKK
ncbi:MAG: glycerol-3-phosphate 1-O-acyltransferase PlsY [Verrucomicrobia bacterium]|nr:glycerol-3-phosphate 1-O-acyltransferase PlsY [Verrucomicrobiota bacterium]MCH8513157.1 glycerol-3-phosphate 1-O-acyltransferase PlsY [Kiritimatiellia bacterium]